MGLRCVVVVACFLSIEPWLCFASHGSINPESNEYLKPQPGIAVALQGQACNESYDGGLEYQGCQDHSRSGRKCQKWNEHSPHKHENSPDHQGKNLTLGLGPDGAVGNHNYCRNPDHHHTIWCYTTDPDKRWEPCDPLIVGLLVTECEKTPCKAEFAALDTTGKRDVCAMSRAFATWPGNHTNSEEAFAACCPTMKDVGMCALNKCTSPGTDTMMLSSIGTDVDLSFFWRTSGLICDCASTCANFSQIIFETLAKDQDALKLIGAMTSQGMDHPLMPRVCSATGWPCIKNSDSCTKLSELKDMNLRSLVSAVGSLEKKLCPKPAQATTTGMTQQQPNATTARPDTIPVSSAHGTTTGFTYGTLIFVTVALTKSSVQLG